MANAISNQGTVGHTVIAAVTGADTRIWALHTDVEHPAVTVTNHGGSRRHHRAVLESRANDTGVSDVPYFVDVAHALASATNIVVLGHGTGNANVARRFLAWSRDHDPGLHGRIVRVEDRDIPALTDAQLHREGRLIWRSLTA